MVFLTGYYFGHLINQMVFQRGNSIIPMICPQIKYCVRAIVVYLYTQLLQQTCIDSLIALDIINKLKHLKTK